VESKIFTSLGINLSSLHLSSNFSILENETEFIQMDPVRDSKAGRPV